MTDTTIQKIDSSESPHGPEGQKYLASGKQVSMRMWERVEPESRKEERSRAYETVGFVLSGRAKLHMGEQVIALNPGDSWVVPEGAPHRYEILEPFSAVEATAPPSQVKGRDLPQAHP
jgi:quercetin dioxygenase-like cupin family protein